MGQSTMGVTKMLPKVLSLLGLSVGLTLSQDTYTCPDGWVISDVGGVVDCILLGGFNEMVTKQDAEIICSFHDAWLVDLDEEHGGQKNRFIANLINDEQSNWDGGGSVQPVMDAIMTMTGVTGPGITQALKSLGSTGLIMNQMIGTVRTVSLTSPSLIHSASMPLTGMTGTVNKRQDTSVERLELK